MHSPRKKSLGEALRNEVALSRVLRDYSAGMRYFRRFFGVVQGTEKFAPFVGASYWHVRGRLYGDRQIRAEVTADEIKNAGWGLVCALRWLAEHLRQCADELDAAADERANQLRNEGTDVQARMVVAASV